MTSISVRRALPDVVGTVRWWVTSRERAIVLIQLGCMLEAELPLSQAVDILASQSPKALARCLRRIYEDLKTGLPIDQALSRHLSIDAAILRTEPLGPALTRLGHAEFSRS